MKTQAKIIALLLGATILIGFGSCTETVTKEEHRTEIANLIETNETKQDSIERMYITTLDEIDNNLDAIRDKEGLIVMGPKSNNDLGITKREQILNNISMINTLLADNKAKMAKLERSLSSYKHGKKELLNSINQAKERITAQEQQIAELKTLLAENDYKITELNKKLDEQTLVAETVKQENVQLDKDLNRVYFASGSYKELRDKNILMKEGGVLGLGKTKTLTKDLNKGSFTEMSKKENTTIALSGEKPKVITKHPINSYTITIDESNHVAQLDIKDPESFWSVSKYLVVETGQ